ncbi:MAG: hypothetical protein DMF68_13650 [Acidobacteria bacterium]|nr:MAG: hypothetical protein DMF68_13650 [Acidobacteriota bacterium]
MAEIREKIFGFPVIVRDDIRSGQILLVEEPQLDLEAARIVNGKMVIPIQPAKILGKIKCLEE